MITAEHPHPFEGPPGSVCILCGSPWLALIHAMQQIRDNPCLSAEDVTPSPVPPFPQEPACESCGEPASGRSLDGVPLCSRCGEALAAEQPEHGMGLGLLTEALIEDGLIGPFPAEPAFGSPSEAAETIRAVPPRAVEQWRAFAQNEHALYRKEAEAATLRCRAQRDALAEALERLRDSLVDFEEFPVVKQSREALRKAGR